MNETEGRGAIGGLLSAMIRMIPDACEEHGLEPCTDVEHNAAIVTAAELLYGHQRATWEPVLRDIAARKYG